jgi:hypothetical protein
MKKMPINESLTRLLETSPETLAKLQSDAIKEHAISILERAILLIKEDRYDDLREMLVSSPSGDCMGTDHFFIDFVWDVDANDGVDLEEVTTLLEQLKTKIEGFC